MRNIGKVFRAVIGMHRIARALGHLWGRLPTWEVALAVVEGSYRFEVIAEIIQDKTAHYFPDLPSIFASPEWLGSSR